MMDALQAWFVLCPIIAVAVAVWVGGWRGAGAAVAVMAIAVLLSPVAAQATTKLSGGPASVANHRYCNWVRVKEQRYGVLDQKLWELRETVTWCINQSHTKVNWISRSWGHWAVGGTWKFVSAQRSGRRAADRSWYSRRISAVFDGYTPFGLFNEQDTPYVWLKVYANARGHFAWRTGCGC